MKLTINSDQVRNSGRDLKFFVNDLRANLNGIELLIAGLEGDWQGEAEREYASKIVYVRSEFNELEKFLLDLSEMMDRFADEYDEHEDSVSSKISAV